MKLTKRLLAIVLAAAMLVGMVAISSSAVQLDEAVESLTWDDCIIDKDSNPYTVKLGFKIYKVDTASGEYTLLADTNAANDTYDVSVEAGDVLRVESWVQTNFHTIGIQLSPVYNNAWLLPTKMTDYSTFTLKAVNAGAKVSLEDGMPAVENFDDSYGSGDGSFEAPIYSNEALTPVKGQTNHNAYNGIKACLPNDWKGKGTTATNWYSTTAVDEYGNTIADANGNMIYNVYQFGCTNNSSGDEAWTGFATVLNVYQPICAFNLTVGENAEGMSRLFFPVSGYQGTTNPSTWVQAFDYDAVQESPNVNGNWDESMPQVCSSGISSYKNTVTYPDGTVTDKNWIVTNATITVGGGSTEPEEPSTSETTTEAAKADLTALQAAIAAAATADTANCTSASVAEFNAALAAANALNVEGTLATEQAAIDAAATRLQNAITGLTPLGACDYTALDAAIAAYEAKVADKDLYENWADYEAAYNTAKAVARDLVADEAGANQATINNAAAALNAVVLVYKAADYSAVEAAKAKIPADLSGYTAASVKAVEDAVAAVVEGYDITKQAEVDAFAAAITDAVAKLAPLGACDYTALDAAIAEYDVLNSAEYTPASWTAADVDALYAAAKAVERDMIADEAGANQAAIDAAAKALDAAIDALVPVADKADLAAAIARASALTEDTYTPASWTAADLATVLTAANVVNADANASQDAVDAQVAAIEAAEAKLVVKADKTALAEAIAVAKAFTEDTYTPASWTEADLATVIAAAQVVYDDGNADAAAITAAIESLTTAAAKLVVKADKTALLAAINTLPAYAQEDADPTTWAAYEAELVAANEVYDDANATQDAVDAAEASLLAAIAAVTEREIIYCDYTALDAAIAAYEAKVADADLYANWAGYQAAYDVATAIARGTEYTADAQAAIDAAAAALNDYVLEYKPADYSAVEAAEATIPADLSIYTAASVKAVTDAVDAVVYDLDITKQAEVNAYAAAITDAVAKLVPLGACDYAALDAAIAAYEAKVADKDIYANWAGYEAAYNDAKAIERDMLADEAGANQAAIDAAAAALNDYVLEVKPADYSAVEAAEATIPADLSIYTSASAKAVTDAVDAVVYDLDITKQAEVDAFAAAITDAVANLVPLEACDYTALDAALALVPAEAAEEYTAQTWEAYAEAKAAAEAIARDLLDDEAGKNQAAIDAAAAELVDAYNNLKINQSNITNIAFDNEGYYAQASLEYNFTMNGAPSKLQVITAGGSTMTFDRRSTRVTVKSYNADGEEVDYATEDPAYEIWTISLALKEGEYTARAKYGYIWDTERYAFTVAYDEYDETAEAFTASVGEYVDATAVTAAKGEVITFKVITDSTAVKVQMVLAGGSTSTYTTSKAVDNGDGTFTWTITRTFTKDQDINLKIKTPTGWATEYAGNVKVTIA